MIQIKKTILTLALLIMAVGGAWAQTPELLVTIENAGDNTSFKSGSKTFDDKVTVTFSNSVSNDGNAAGWYSTGDPSLLTVAGINGYTITSCKFYTQNGDAANGYTVEGESPSVYLSGWNVYTDDSQIWNIGTFGVKKIEVYGAAEPTEWSLTPDETGKTWTLAKMPASNIELQVEYFAESNLFLSKDALADKANIAVKAGELGVQFGDDGKSANTVTEGTAMTVKYNGTKKLLGMKVEKKEESLIVNPVVGQIIGSDGKNYAYGSLPTGVTAVAKICYVSGSNGLALALTDEEGEMNWSTAQTTCTAHTPAITGGTWKLPSKDEWDNMISAAGSFTDLRDGFSSVGGTNLQSGGYWSSTEKASDLAWYYYFYYGGWGSDNKDRGFYVRPCLAF